MLFPGLVMHYKSDAPKVDPSTITIEVDGGYNSGYSDTVPFQ